MGGVEVYYDPGPLMFGTEFYFNQVTSGPANDPFFNGGDIFAAYLTDGSQRVYNKKGGYLSDNIRLEIVYGYSELDRFGQTGTTQFVQTRLQISFI